MLRSNLWLGSIHLVLNRALVVPCAGGDLGKILGRLWRDYLDQPSVYVVPGLPKWVQAGSASHRRAPCLWKQGPNANIETEDSISVP